MPLNDLDYEELVKTLADNFIFLADEVQLLSDRKTILEHKLRFAHEQVSTTTHSLRSCRLCDEKLSSRSGAVYGQQRPTISMYPDSLTCSIAFLPVYVACLRC